MNIGDRVRVTRGIEEGVVTRFLANNIVEIEIEDGFTIHVLKNELTLIAKEEAQIFGSPKTEEVKTPGKKAEKKRPPVFAQKGIYLAYMPGQTHYTRMHLVNNTDMDVAYSIAKAVNDDQCQGVKAGVLKARSYEYVLELDLDQFERWPALQVQVIFHNQQLFTKRAPMVAEVHSKAATFYRSKRTVPVIEREGFLIQVDAHEKPAPVPAQKLREQLMGDNDKPRPNVVSAKKVTHELDLHINKLRKDHKSIPEKDILQIQLNAMEQHLDEAIAAGAEQVTYIHGVGNYRLRDEIHRRLGKHEHIDYFKEARKEKFGYGATDVKIK